ncbi:MAG: hypothetical protein RLY86_4225 [Pseudomonadota bacterium]|jgi:pimeloyl-ACP methyl ester carboxylesterase
MAAPASLSSLASSAPRDGVVTLPDGRRLGYAEYGDPAGPVIVYLHGYPNCRREAGLMPLPGVRLIAPDRPGYGLSDPLPGRGLRAVAADVAALLDALGLDRVRLIGLSGGAPYAAALAHDRPDRIAATAFVCPLGPAAVSADSPAALLHALGRRPRLLPLVAGVARTVILRGDPLALAGRLRRGRAMTDPDLTLLTADPGRALLSGWREALRPGVQGAVDDAVAYAGPWGFDPAAIRGPVTVWHGTADRTVPVAAGRWYARCIPGAVLQEKAGEGHFSLVHHHHGAIVADLLARGRS